MILTRTLPRTLTRGQSGWRHRARGRVAVVCLAVAAVMPLIGTAAPAWARVRHNDAWARKEFAKAERTREALNGRPANQRTRHEYQRAIDAYRSVYFGRPTSSKADPSVVATAELMVEMGHRFNDDKILREAVDEYRFLRKEYPGSKYRSEALFTIGEIYKDDLNDPAQAQKAFEDFLHRYPKNRLGDDARAAVKEIDDEAAAAKSPKGHKQRGQGSGKAQGVMAQGSSGTGKTPAQMEAQPQLSNQAQSNQPHNQEAKRSDLARVTGVRHWSTPDYTRVAIDVEQEVKFNSQRIAGPDRIFFDILDTKLASTLVGKTFDVDDGFLKKIRVAENKPGQTRIVLEVDNLSSYDAFLLPDPYRLIIDIHGKQGRTAQVGKAQGEDGMEGTGDGSSSSADSSVSNDSDDVTAEPVGPVKKEKEHAIVAKVDDEDNGDETSAEKRSESLKEELAKEAAGGESASAGNSGIVKTTVVVKGSNRTIPKTIVAADGDRSAGNGCSETTSAAKAARGNGSANAALKRCATQNQKNAEANDKALTQSRKNVDEGGNAQNHRGSTENQSDRAEGENGSRQPPTRGNSGKLGSSKLNSNKIHSNDDDAGANDRVESAKITNSNEGISEAQALSSPSASPSAATGPASTYALKTSSRRKKPSRAASASATAEDNDDVETREAQPMAAGNRSLTRALGLKIGKIVIDAGHGGHDTGTIGPNGLLEKDVVLDVAKRLGRLLETRLGAEVIYTRHDDTFIPLETRTAIANRAQADLFISIHANSSRDEDSRGVETYYLNFTSSPEALEVAARENAVSEKSVHELQDLVKKIALKEKIEESHEFASDVQDSLYGGLALNNAGIRNRGVKKAPFIVLIGANMPSILAEISFVSNPTDARKLVTSEHRQRIAEALYRGVSRYAGGLSGVKVASKITKGEGQ